MGNHVRRAGLRQLVKVKLEVVALEFGKTGSVSSCIVAAAVGAAATPNL